MEPNVQFLAKYNSFEAKTQLTEILLLVYVNHAVTYRKQDN